MNGPEHYLAAEELLYEVNREQEPTFDGTVHPVYPQGLRVEMIAQAQAHATLAHTAAIIDAGNTIGYEGGDQVSYEVHNSQAWKGAIK